MKKVLVVLLAVLVFIFIALFSIPFLFKDKIKAAVDKSIAKSVNAKVYYEAENFSLSLIKHFPNVSVNLKQFGVINNAPFEGDTLANIGEFDLVVDIMSVISGDKMKIKSVYLDQPNLFVQVTKGGLASWDIMIASSDTTKSAEPEAASDFSLSIDSWEIKNGNLVYNDAASPLYAKVVNLNHSGSGDLKSDIFDMATKTKADEVTVVFDSIPYLNKVKLDADMTMNMDMKNSKYTFKDNKFLINAFAFGFDGSVATPIDNSLIFDIKFAAKETEFKNILSLVPGIFTKDFDKLKTEGVVAFDGYYKGIAKDSTQSPGFGLNLKIDKGMFQYPDLPTAVTNVFCDLMVDNKDGIIDNIIVDLKKFHMDMGPNPVDARAYMAGLTNMKLDADVKAKLNLADIQKVYPVDGIDMKGLFALLVNAKGVYNKKEKKMPTVTANMNLTNGYVKSKDFPKPLENLNMSADVANPTGVLNDTKVQLNKLSLLLDGEPLNASGNFSNFDDVNYDVKVNGIIDLGKMTKIFPLDSMSLAGKIIADIATKGKMSQVTGGKYDQLTTSGKMDFKAFEFKSFALPQGFKITDGSLNFTPEKVNITKLNGFLGKSDIDINGYVANYMGYLFSNGTIKGQMNFASNTFNVDEWMMKDPKAPKPAEPTKKEATKPVEIPKTIDFVLSSTINKVIYDKFDITNLKGDIIIKDGALNMRQIALNMLDGSFVINGGYDSKVISKPLFNFDLDMKSVSISKAFNAFNAIQAFAPAAKDIEGNASMKFKINGDLDQGMSPVMSTLNGGGLINILNAVIKNNNMLGKIADLTKNESLRHPSLQNTLLQAEIKDGRAFVKPFDLKAGDYTANIGGSQGLDGTLDYVMKMDVPGGAITQAASSIASQFGLALDPAEKITMNFKIGGTSSNPKIVPTGVSTSGKGKTNTQTQIKEQVQKQVEQKVDEVKKQAEDRAKQEAERIRKENEDKVKKDAEDKLKDVGKSFGF
ncbi:MAG: AsmA family protein [Opitutaceae bacterium]|nr:AsmA family protein [Cytophagales bacterium]